MKKISGLHDVSVSSGFSVYSLAYAGVFIAMNIVLSRLVSIPIGPTLRISIGSVPIILSGLFLGPFLGGASGAAGDLLGCAISGYAPNPLLTLSAVLMGILPSLFRNFIANGKGINGYLRVLAVLAFTMLLTSQGTTTLGLALMYGMSFWPTFIMRLPQTCLLLIVNSFLVTILYSRVRLPGNSRRRKAESGNTSAR